MKEHKSKEGLRRICGLFGITRQAYYGKLNRRVRTSLKEGIVLEKVKELRTDQPRLGTRKLYNMLRESITSHGIKMGRDGMFDLLSANGMLIKKRRRRVKTTLSRHWMRKYPNLIKEMEITSVNQLWVSDITYVPTTSGFMYLSLITDAYSRKIVGYEISSSLETVYTFRALQMALGTVQKPIEGLIHHSDRGIQYCSNLYVKQLEAYGISISMTENGDPRENAIAERVNGIIKQELLEYQTIKGLRNAKEQIARAIDIYNTKRPHMSCSMMTPEKAHLTTEKLTRTWKTYYTKKPEDVNILQDH